MSEWRHTSSEALYSVPVRRPRAELGVRHILIALAAAAAITATVVAVIWQEKPAQSAAAAAAPVAAPTSTPGTPPRQVEKSPPVPEATTGDGTYLVGRELKTGTYSSRGGTSCYWARLRDTSGEQIAVIAAGTRRGRQVVTIRKGDRAFVTDGCGTWELMKP